MNTIKKVFKHVVDYFTADPEWVREEAKRLSADMILRRR